MGTCHVLMHKNLLDMIQHEKPYCEMIRILEVNLFEENLFNVYLESNFLDKGYQGQQEIIIEDGWIEFKREADT